MQDRVMGSIISTSLHSKSDPDFIPMFDEALWYSKLTEDETYAKMIEAIDPGMHLFKIW